MAGMLTIADIAEELDRRVWLDDHPGVTEPDHVAAEAATVRADWAGTIKALLDAGVKDEIIKQVEALIPETEEVEEEEEFFRSDRVRGASGMFGYCLRAYATNIHDIAPSIGGVARKQGLALGAAHGQAGVAVQPKPRTWAEKVTFRNRDKDKVSGGT